MATLEQKHKSTIPGTPVIGTPVLRKRQPMATTNKGNMDEQEKEHARRQHEAAKRHEENLKRIAEETNAAGLNVSTQLTHESHVGKVPEEPHKPAEMVALGGDVKERTGVDKVKTVDRITPGKGATDKVVVEPKTAAALGQTSEIKSEAQKVSEAAQGKQAKTNGPKSAKKGSKK